MLQSVLINKPKFVKVTSYKNKEKCNTEVHGGGDLSWYSWREPAPSRAKPDVIPKNNAPGSLSVSRALLTLVERNRPWSEFSFLLRNVPVCAFDSSAQRFS